MRSGKLYSCTDYYLFIYPSMAVATSAADVPAGMTQAKETAVAVATVRQLAALRQVAAGQAVGPKATQAAVMMMLADWWSRKLDCKVRSSEPNEVFLCLEYEDKFAHVLFGEKQGWIINKTWLGIERVK